MENGKHRRPAAQEEKELSGITTHNTRRDDKNYSTNCDTSTPLKSKGKTKNQKLGNNEPHLCVGSKRGKLVMMDGRW